MRKNTSACGLCKPHKKWKMNHTKKARVLKRLFITDFGEHVKLREPY